MEPSAIIEIDMFDPAVDSPYHPDALRFRRLLEDVAREHRCELTFFAIDAGTVSFAFDSDELAAKIIKVLRNER